MQPRTIAFLFWAAVCLAGFLTANLLWGRTSSDLRFAERVQIAPNVYRHGGKMYVSRLTTYGWPLHYSQTRAEVGAEAAPPRTVATRFSAGALALNVAFFLAMYYLLASLFGPGLAQAFGGKQVLVWCLCLGVLAGVVATGPDRFLEPIPLYEDEGQ